MFDVRQLGVTVRTRPGSIPGEFGSTFETSEKVLMAKKYGLTCAFLGLTSLAVACDAPPTLPEGVVYREANFHVDGFDDVSRKLEVRFSEGEFDEQFKAANIEVAGDDWHLEALCYFKELEKGGFYVYVGYCCVDDDACLPVDEWVCKMGAVKTVTDCTQSQHPNELFQPDPDHESLQGRLARA